MASEAVARNYAGALFEVAEREGAAPLYGEGLRDLARLVEETPQLALFLETPRVESAAKKAVLREAFEGRMPEHFVNFLLLLVDRRRQRMIPEIAREYGALLDRREGRIPVELSLAREPEPDEMERISAALGRILGGEAVPVLRVRPELLGGVVFRSGDTIFDGSVRGRLRRLRRHLMTADLRAALQT